MLNWKTYILSEVVDKGRGISYGIVQPGTFVEEGIPIIKVNNLTDRKLSYTDLQKVKPEVEAKYQRTKLRGNEILISLVGSLGYVAKVKQEMIGWNVARAIGVLPIAESFDKDWIYWFLKSPQAQNFIHGQATTSVQATLNLKELQELQVAYPDEVYRTKATEILSALDDKIELNRRMNQTLEQMAQTLFRQYFVDGIDEENLPEGWREGKLSETLDLVYGKALKQGDRKGGKYPVVGSSGVVGFHDTYIAIENGIVVGRKGNAGAVIWLDEKFYPIDTTFYVKDLLEVDGLYYHYFHLKSLPLAEMNSDSAVPGLNRNDAYDLDINIPAREQIKKFNKEVEPLFERKSCNAKEIKTLTTLRDTLLPKLMSGEIDVVQTKPEELHEQVLS